MNRPSIKELQLKNPAFFREDSTDLAPFAEDRNRRIDEEDGRWVLKIRTAHDTFPVYEITEDLTLNYLRHGWEVSV